MGSNFLPEKLTLLRGFETGFGKIYIPIVARDVIFLIPVKNSLTKVNFLGE